jgi:hypothetical protein
MQNAIQEAIEENMFQKEQSACFEKVFTCVVKAKRVICGYIKKRNNVSIYEISLTAKMLHLSS